MSAALTVITLMRQAYVKRMSPITLVHTTSNSNILQPNIVLIPCSTELSRSEYYVPLHNFADNFSQVIISETSFSTQSNALIANNQA